jgi:hypothetical protein
MPGSHVVMLLEGKGEPDAADFTEAASIAALFSAAEGLGVSVYRINTLGDTDSLSYSVIFKDGGGGFAALLTYLSVFIGEYLPIGIYKNLE